MKKKCKANTAWCHGILRKLIWINCKHRNAVDSLIILSHFCSSGGIAQSINFTLSNGLCLPASCSQEKVLEFVNSHLQTVDLKAVEANCQTSDSLPFDGVDIAAM